MRCFALIALTLAGCTVVPQPWTSVPTTHHRTPLPPSKLVPDGPAFSFIDHGSGTNYWIWLYEDAEALHNQVVVQEQGQYPRDASC